MDKTPSLVAKAIDYILGRNTLIGIASFMLLIISGYATWHGMRDFIVGVSATTAASGSGAMSIPNDVLVILVVVALTFLMWLMLRETFGAQRQWRERIVTFPLYCFLAMWSIGFGYGFWWSLISGEEATRTGLAGLQEDARDASAIIAARLDAVRGQLDSVVSWSDTQMSREETAGGSCGTPSGAGRGPLYNARRGVRDSVTTLRNGMTRSWLEPVQADIENLRQAAAQFEGGSVEERQRAFEARASEIRGRARNIAARSNQLGRSTAGEMRALASSVAIAPNQAGFTCYDPTLAERLRAAAGQAEQPAELKLREAVFNEGPAGVANAVKNLWRNIGAYTSGLLAYVFSGGNSDVFGRTGGGEPITGRDLIALLATIGIDLGLLALAVVNPPREPPSIRPSGQLARQINDAIETAINRAQKAGADREWVRRHFVHHNKRSYFVIPNLYSCDPTDEGEAARGVAINQLAGVLSDLKLIEWPAGRTKIFGLVPLPWAVGELDALKDEESHPSTTDLTEIRRKWAEEHDFPEDKKKAYVERQPIRNHGLFSKAERALQIAGWSEKARSDLEIFHVVEAEGLTPLLMVLNDATPRADGRAAQPAQQA